MRLQKSELQAQRTENRGQKTVGKGQRAEDSITSERMTFPRLPGNVLGLGACEPGLSVGRHAEHLLEGMPGDIRVFLQPALGVGKPG